MTIIPRHITGLFPMDMAHAGPRLKKTCEILINTNVNAKNAFEIMSERCVMISTHIHIRLHSLMGTMHRASMTVMHIIRKQLHIRTIKLPRSPGKMR